MFNLGFIQKIVILADNTSPEGLLLPIPTMLLIFIMALSIFFILYGEKRERISGQLIILLLGLYYTSNIPIQLAYGVTAISNIFYIPILKIPIFIVTLAIYSLVFFQLRTIYSVFARKAPSKKLS